MTSHEKPIKGLIGVYKMENVVTGAVYVGASTAIPTRWHSHMRLLNGGMHHNPRFQTEYDKHGMTAYRFSVLEIVDRISDLEEREVFWIKKLSAESIVHNRMHAKDTRTLVSVHRDVKAKLQDMNPQSINEAVKTLLEFYEKHSPLSSHD